MTALEAAEVWRDRFLESALEADDEDDKQACFDAAASLERLREGLERIQVMGGKAS